MIIKKLFTGSFIDDDHGQEFNGQLYLDLVAYHLKRPITTFLTIFILLVFIRGS